MTATFPSCEGGMVLHPWLVVGVVGRQIFSSSDASGVIGLGTNGGSSLRGVNGLGTKEGRSLQVVASLSKFLRDFLLSSNLVVDLRGPKSGVLATGANSTLAGFSCLLHPPSLVLVRLMNRAGRVTGSKSLSSLDAPVS